MGRIDTRVEHVHLDALSRVLVAVSVIEGRTPLIDLVEPPSRSESVVVGQCLGGQRVGSTRHHERGDQQRPGGEPNEMGFLPQR